jgi:preprotein translocase subunit Sss1
MCDVDKRLEQKINEKIEEALANIHEIHQLAKSLNTRDDSESFKYGLVIGRLYNSFYYQCRRILRRDPTNDEFLKFLQILNKRENEILKKLS